MISTTKARRLTATAALLGATLAGACSDDAPEAPGSSTPGIVTIEDFTFKPGELEIAAGTTVTFTNEDGFAHTATAEDESFDTGSLEQDATFEHTFTEPGTYEYLCAIHNSMTGTITVS